jgi:hypothetical protein
MAGDANNAEAPRICKSIIGSRVAVLEEMSKKISLLFATDVIGRSTFGPRVFRGWSEVEDEMTNADRVCFRPITVERCLHDTARGKARSLNAVATFRIPSRSTDCSAQSDPLAREAN